MTIKRIVVAGCRNNEEYGDAKAFIDLCNKENGENNTLIFLSGGCRGADMLGERYAKEHGFTIERHPADWQAYQALSIYPHRFADDNTKRWLLSGLFAYKLVPHTHKERPIAPKCAVGAGILNSAPREGDSRVG